jgi:anaerobic magnesium-protoporphyrin IX monomethyl ester cyclase
MAKVLIININWRNLTKIGRLRKYDPLLPQELMYIDADLRRNNVESKLIDLWGEDREISNIKEDIKHAEILIFCSAPSYHFWQDGTIDEDLPRVKTNQIKEINPNIKIILVGPHGSVKPETFFNSKIDYIVRGEPDLETTKLIQQIEEGKRVDLDTVCWRENDKWIVGEKSATVEDMTQLPILRYDELDPKHYSWPTSPEGYQFKRTSVFEASRGCPFNCVFCFRKGFRGKFREKSLDQVRQELDLMKKQQYEYFFIIDEVFGMNKEWTKEVCKEMGKRGFKWGCEVRPEHLNEEIIEAFAENGCIEVRTGLESADREVLKKIGKGTVDLRKLKEDVENLVRRKVNVKFFCIAGLPGSSRKSIRKTLRYVLQFNPLIVNAATNIMFPYPGTAIWHMAIKEGKKLEGWSDLETYAGIIGNNFKSPKEVLKEVARFNATILQNKSKTKIHHDLKKGLKTPMFTLKSVLAYGGCAIIKVFPSTYPFFVKFYRFLIK